MDTFPTLVGLTWDIKKRVIFKTAKEEAASGAQFATSRWSIPHYEFDMTFEYLSQADRDALEAFYIAQLGGAKPFLLPMTNDSSMTARQIGTGNASNVNFQVPLPAQANIATDGGVSVTDFQGTMPRFTTARTNLCLQSQAYDNASWTKNASTITADAASAPDGFTTADMLKEDGTTAGHYASQNIAVVNGTQYAVTVWAKETGLGSKRYLTVGLTSAGFGVVQWAAFDCSGTGAVTSTSGGATAIITKIGSWFRCTLLTIAATSSTNTTFQTRLTNNSANGVAVYAGDSTSGMYVWGAQFEAGTAVTSYLPTTTATVTEAGYTLSAIGQLVLGLAPRNGAPVLWTGTYAYVVKFKDDELEFGYLWNGAYEQEGITFRTFR